MFFHFTDLELESEIPKFSEVIRFIEDLLLITEASHYVDNYLIDKDLERTGPIQYEKIGQFAKSLVAISKREIAVPFTDRKNYLHLSQ
ncbi:hypothetical protein MFLO_14562 [Listeria floridensis FSL S10-1187]|uniref:Uncharacterized protein n=1 Tax=Listeria floridensis FSL S10-1187 TaxID=1265817 RepID=A0ABP3AWZ1_9LIST|nr:hypothetical protein [Listeria floridensis]EUJ25984.1 hypothetical protein MFLO_14562 [Listeria floridensis FSL S10-1187]